MKNAFTPEFLSIGHLCHDVAPGGFAPGGSVGFACGFAARQGLRTAALTSFGPEFLFRKKYAGIALRAVPADKTTLFENIYDPEGRRQILHARAADLRPEHLPKGWRESSVVLLNPIADEVSTDFFRTFPSSFVCACPQGWMRRWDADGRVFQKSIDFWDKICACDLVCMSENDVGNDWDFIESLGQQARLLAVTRAAAGAVVFQNGKKRGFPAIPVEEKNPTGAGDVFAAAFALRFLQSGDLEKAVAYAHAAASFCVQRIYRQPFGTKRAIEKRAAAYFAA